MSFKGFFGFLRWAGIGAASFGALACLSVALLFGYRYVTTSTYFSVKPLEVEGNFRLTSREVLEIAGVREGANALMLSTDAMERGLARNPWVADVAVKRVLPDRFVIRITEREPKFWVRHGGALFYADALGRPIVEVSPGKFASFPALEVEQGAEDMTRRLPELLASLADSRLAVDHSAISLVRLSAGRGVEVLLGDEKMVLSIGYEEWADNLNRLAATLNDVTRRGEIRDVREVRAHGPAVWVIRKRPLAS